MNGMSGTSGIAKRTARFRTVIAMKGALPSLEGSVGFEKTAEGVVHGAITTEPQGDNGFGYDPIFLVDGTGKTYAEMSTAEKNSLSHRALALQNALADLRQRLQQQNILLTNNHATA